MTAWVNDPVWGWHASIVMSIATALVCIGMVAGFCWILHKCGFEP